MVEAEETPVEELPSEPTTPENANPKYLTIKEWGVKLEVPRGLKHDMMYSLGGYGGDGAESVADISSRISLDGDAHSVHAYIIRSLNSSFQPLKYKLIGKIGEYYYFAEEADLIEALLVNATTTLTSVM